MLERHVGKVEMDTLKQQVGSHQHILVLWITEDGAVVAHALQCGRVLQFNCLGEMTNESELTQFLYLHPPYTLLISSFIKAVIRGWAASAANCTSS